VTGILADESGMGMNCSSVPDIYRDFGTTQKDATHLETGKLALPKPARTD
jgi:hypothetical protein